ARRDTPEKVTGRAIYGIDVRPPDAQVALVALAPTAGGTIGEMNREAALAVAGVTQLVNEGDLVAVVARDTWSAIKGMKALAPRWIDGANADVQQAALVAELEAAVHEPGVIAATRGKATAPRAALHHEVLYHQPLLAHATMEPTNCTAHWRDNQCELWVGTQAPDRVVRKLAPLGLQPGQIRLNNQLLGGGFGRRLEADNAVIGARVARQVHGPVRVMWERAEDIRHDRFRPFYVDRLAAALDAKGHILSWQHTIAGPALQAIHYDLPLRNEVDADVVECAANTVYEFENMEVRYVRRDPRGVAVSWWRGVGATRSIFAVESFIDELAAAAHQDPVAFRRAQLKDARMLAVFDLAADRAGWNTGLPAGSGRGIAIQRAFGSYLAQVAEVSMDAQGQPRVERVVCAFDCGQIVNPDGVRAQLEGGITFGLGSALLSEITIADGRVEQSNFNDYPLLRMNAAPRIEVHLVASREAPGGVGETGTVGAAAALCNAIAAASGKRVRRLPVARTLHA
ncbi:MAG: xanthine dehydrogenase family protein molybdopterin-binding subunit, partial [Gammaproteobacteria bacterium]|nr:xanthine dehydrogenase family protein molybdopterin-binding subunit [Gammaproteobacteria bacterium]